MYLKFFNLKEFPFSIGSDERFFYESDIHAEAFANMLYTLQQRKGMVLITGEIGAGKTFLGKMLASRIGESSLVGMVEDPPDSPKQLLRSVAVSLGIRVPDAPDKLALTSELKRSLDGYCRQGRLAAVIFDEVQAMPDEALEEVRLMWNWERKGQRLLQMVLIGQPDLRPRLRQPRWEPLRQRIVLSYHLARLGARDTAWYILHRRKVAAENGSPLRFTLQAMEDIYAASKGVPRLINVICDNALLSAYAGNTTKVTSAIVAKVVKEMVSISLDGSSLGDEQPGQ